MLRVTGTTFTESVLCKQIYMLHSLQEPPLQLHFHSSRALFLSAREKFVNNAL